VGGPDDVERIRLHVIVEIKGEHASVSGLTYHVTAIGKLAAALYD
jgi:hypothetical protein